MKELTKVLLQAAHGRAAEILAEQAKVSTEDVVQHFLGPRGDDLYWSLRLSGNWGLLAGDKRPSIGEVRERLDDLASAYEELALTMCDRAVGYCNNTDDERAGVREEFRLLGFSERETEIFLSEPWKSSERLNRATSDIRAWMHAYPANGRGSVASIVVAEVVAAFFDKARMAAEIRNDAETVKLLRVKLARTNDGKGPANSYCRAVESALRALGVRGAPSKISPQGALGGGWRGAVETVCKLRDASTSQQNDPAFQ
ncbi:hypothetical protein [Roseovarius nubinhibens]|uniref:hypothetical protein n=1 Tax=Roseovarius nubinhibens TaxID=314263 RepID=UPI0030EDA33B|tara:strand:+ start:4715 stop:5485 length:771 start_codon:yes stop_codon:yes gene_type:complete